jgi:hypothetical protein
MFGGTGDDTFLNWTPTSDGGYVAVGFTNSPSLSNMGQYDSLIVKYDSFGRKEWARTLGSHLNDEFLRVAELNDGSYVAAGMVQSGVAGSSTIYGGHAFKGYTDAVAARYDKDGNRTSLSVIAGSNYDFFYGVAPSPDGGYLMAGYTSSSDVGVAPSMESSSVKDNGDIFLVKYDNSNNINWRKAIGGTKTDRAVEIKQDGYGYMLVGETTSSDVAFSGKDAYGDWDVFAMRINSNGSVSSTTLIGGKGKDYARSIVPVSGGFVVTGETDSQTMYKAPGSSGANSNGAVDGFVAKLDSRLYVSWIDMVGGSGDDNIWSAAVTPSSDIVVAGTTMSTGGGDFAGVARYGSEDAFIKRYKLDGTGGYAPVRLGAAGASTVARSILALGDDVAVCGYTNASDSGKFLGYRNNGGYDAFVMITSLSGEVIRILGNMGK